MYYDSASRGCGGPPLYPFPDHWVRPGGGTGGGTLSPGVATVLSSPFTMPAANATGIANVENVDPFSPGQVVFVSPLGYLTITATGGGPGPGTLTLRNLGYSSNQAAGEIAPTGSPVATGVGPGPQGPVGPAGTPGLAATVGIGTVASGTPAAVTNSGSATAAVLNFTLPKGDKGDPGEGLTVGSATPPPTPDPGDLWSTINGELFIWRGSFWMQVG